MIFVSFCLFFIAHVRCQTQVYINPISVKERATARISISNIYVQSNNDSSIKLQSLPDKGVLYKNRIKIQQLTEINLQTDNFFYKHSGKDVGLVPRYDNFTFSVEGVPRLLNFPIRVLPDDNQIAKLRGIIQIRDFRL